MAPKKKVNIKKDNPKPFIKFENQYKVYDAGTAKERKVLVGYKPILREGGLTEEIIATGDLETLENFWNEKKDDLNPEEKEYMKARVSAAREMEKIRINQMAKLADGKTTVSPDPDNKNGFRGFSNIKYPDIQTTGNGCWSYSFSLLLKSRGIELSQEKIRAWRPDLSGQYTNDAEKAEFLKKSNATIQRMNTDSENTVFENADILMDVLPNTSMNQISIKPFESEMIMVDGMPAQGQDLEVIKKYHNELVEQQLRETITRAINVDHSPLAITWDGHYVTITGISEDGKKIRFENSMEAKAEDREWTMSLKDLVHEGMEPHTRKMNNHHYEPKGFDIAWLHDIKVPEYDKKAETKVTIHAEEENLAKLDENGNVTVEVPITHPTTGRVGTPATGQVHGLGISKQLTYDMQELSKRLGGKSVMGFGPGEAYSYGNMDNYFPKKIVYPKDPAIQNYKYIGKDARSSIKKLYTFVDDVIKIESYQNIEVPEWVNKLAPIRDALEDIAAYQNSPKSEENKAKFKNAVNTLKGLQGILNEETEDGTIFAKWKQKVNVTKRPQFIDALQKVDKLIGINLDYSKLLDLSGDEAEATHPNDIEFREMQTQRWGAMSSKMSSVDIKLRNIMLSEILAAEAIRKSKKKAGDAHPEVTLQETRLLAAEYRQNDAFKRMLEDGNDIILAKSKDVRKLISELDEADKLIKAEGITEMDYDISARQKVVQKRCKYIVQKLEDTKTGSYTGLGVIGRRKNTTRYELALEAIRGIAEVKDPSAGEVKSAVEVVKNYLIDKMEVRNRKFGRERFDLCMTFLKEVMPPKEFERYCNSVNKARGVTNDPSSDKYVNPAYYACDGLKSGDLITEAKRRVRSGKGTDRDYATIIAIRQEYDDAGFFESDIEVSNAAERRVIMNRTEKIYHSKSFKRFMKEMTQEQKLGLIKGRCDNLLSYEKLLKPIQKAPVKQ